VCIPIFTKQIFNFILNCTPYTTLIKPSTAIFLLFCTINTLKAQSLVTGYQGRRWYAETNLSVIPTVVGPSYDNYGGQRFSSVEPNAYDLSSRIGGDMYYVAGRRSSVFSGYEYTRTGMIMLAASPSVQLPNGAETTDNDLHHLFYQMRVHTVQVGAEFYTNKSLLAPLGTYFRLAIQYSMLFGDLRERRTDFSTLYAGPNIRELNLNKLSTYEITPVLEIGSRTVLADRLTLSIATRTQLPIFALSELSFSDDEMLPKLDSDAYQTHNLQAFDRAARKRMFWHGIFMLRISVGLLF
jgi:hypothetical protein